MSKLEKQIEKLKDEISDIEGEIENSSDEGWSVLADLSEKMNEKKEQVDEKEFLWLELAEFIEDIEN